MVKLLSSCDFIYMLDKTGEKFILLLDIIKKYELA